jgi:hypothetical protein
MAAPSDEAEPRGSTHPPRDDPRAALEASAIVAPP